MKVAIEMQVAVISLHMPDIVFKVSLLGRERGRIFFFFLMAVSNALSVDLYGC